MTVVRALPAPPSPHSGREAYSSGLRALQRFVFLRWKLPLDADSCLRRDVVLLAWILSVGRPTAIRLRLRVPGLRLGLALLLSLGLVLGHLVESRIHVANRVAENWS